MDGSLGGLAYLETPDFIVEEFFVFLGPFPSQNGAFLYFLLPCHESGSHYRDHPL